MMVESDTSIKIETADTTVAEPAIKPHLILALDYGVKRWAWRWVTPLPRLRVPLIF